MLSSMKKLLIIIGLSLVVVTDTGCPAAKTAAQIAVQVAVDTCSELDQTGVQPGWVALVCAVVDGAGQEVQVLLSKDQWNAMKADYATMHGHLPKDMSMTSP